MLPLRATHVAEANNVVLLPLALPPNHVAEPPVEPAPHMHARVMPAAQVTSVVHVTVAQVISAVHVVRADLPKSLARKPLLETLIPCIHTTR